MGMILQSRGELNKALPFYQKAIALNPKNAYLHYNIGLIFQNINQFSEAETSYLQTIRLNPEHGEAHANLGNLYFTNKQFKKAQLSLEAAVTYSPNSAHLHAGLGVTYYRLSKLDESVSSLNTALLIDPKNINAHLSIIDTLLFLGQYDRAYQHCEQILEIEPNNIIAIVNRASLNERMGQFEKGMKQILPFIESGNKNLSVILAYVELAKRLHKQQEAIDLLEEYLRETSPIEDRAKCRIHFRLGALHDFLKKYDKAFYHFQTGSRLKSTKYSIEKHQALLTSISSTYSEDFVNHAPVSNIESEVPIFIIGMPRSGSSLIEQILGSHPMVHPAGELQNMPQLMNSLSTMIGSRYAFPQCVTELTTEQINQFAKTYLDHVTNLSSTARYVTDKMPENFLMLGLIQQLFPNARIINCLRDPRSLALSCYFQLFRDDAQSFSYDLNHIAHYYKGYKKLMSYWKRTLSIQIIDIQYEALINQPKTEIQRILEFCNLDWSDDCLEFHDNKRQVATASYDQVRQPLYKSSLDRWQHYEKYISKSTKELFLGC